MRYSLEQIDETIFRAYDVRGIVDQNLTDALVYHLGRAFAAYSLAENCSEVVVAADGRLSGPRFKRLLSEGLTDGGCDVKDIGLFPTPVLYYAALNQGKGTGTGIMITGSHNPSDYNGFKMMLNGHTLSGDEIQHLKQRIIDKDYSEGNGATEQLPIIDHYDQYIANDIKLTRPLKIVVDCGNGIAGNNAPALLERLGCEVIPLFCDVDGTFPNHHPDPGKPENLQDVIAAVEEHQADIGLAFDGDGDRVGVVTEKGNIIYPDRVMMLFAEDILSRNPEAEIIYDVKCSRLLAKVIESAGGKATMWKTGHSLIKGRMKETGALLAGEMSGHIFFKERWFGFDDGLYSAARLLEILAASDQSIDQMFSRYPEDVSTPELNITVTDENKFDIISQLQQVEFPDANVSRIDGVRVDFADGWGLVRASNTTPVLVLRFEAENQQALNRIREEFQQHLYQVDAGLTIPQS